MLQVSFSARAKEDKRCLSRLDFFRIFELLLNLVVKLLKLFFQDSKVGIREVLKMYEPIACGGDRPYQFAIGCNGIWAPPSHSLSDKDALNAAHSVLTKETNFGNSLPGNSFFPRLPPAVGSDRSLDV